MQGHDEVTSTTDAVDQFVEITKHRREEASRIAKIAQPKYILNIEAIEVHLVIHPEILPYKHVNPKELIELLEDEYNLTLDISGCSPDIFRSAEIGINTPEKIVNFLLKQDRFMLSFSDGRFFVQKNSFVPINSIRFTYESITANVRGDTFIAEVLIQEVFELLWKISGVQKRWQDQDVQRSIQVKSYGTTTKTQLPKKLIELLSKSVGKFLHENLSSGQKFGAAMMGKSAYNDFKPYEDVISVVDIDELHLKVNNFDRNIGRSSPAIIRISLTSKDEFSRGIASISSEMVYEDHKAFIQGLIDALEQE